MSKNVVNLDGLIPREDFRHESGGANSLANLQILPVRDLDDGVWPNMLKKPDFQRETASWTPDKVIDLIHCFVRGELIPSVILWQSNADIYVIDGAHRLSAILAWIHNDFGDGIFSKKHFNNRIPEEQAVIATRTRAELNKAVGSFADYKAARNHIPENLFGEQVIRVFTSGLFIQWVKAADAAAAEASFFKINQAITPLDPTERRILKSRESAHAISSRAIVRGGAGHKYWRDFDTTKQESIELMASSVHQSLFSPSMNQPIKTSDLPIGGYGYNALPFVFDLVSVSNNVKIADSTNKKNAKDNIPDDKDGSDTVKYFNSVKRDLGLITGTDPSSLGLHPVVYCYTGTGLFQPSYFIATLEFIKGLEQRSELVAFTHVRRPFEDFLLKHKNLLSQIGHELGSGKRSGSRLRRFLEFLFTEMRKGSDEGAVLAALRSHDEFGSVSSKIRVYSDSDGASSSRFGRATKSATFIKKAAENPVRCHICQAWVHKNSMHVDHVIPRREGGNASEGNAGIAHPYCNSTVKQ